MNVAYRHTQVGYLMIVALAAGLVGLASSVALSNWLVLLLPIVILSACLLLFPTLTAVVSDARLRCFFGVGLI